MASFLMSIRCCGLNYNNLMQLTSIMKNSGKVYDYRNNADLNNAKIIRRYPCGALSEKIALIMPACIASLR